MYIPIDEFDQFEALKEYRRDSISTPILERIRNYHEEYDLEEMILQSISEPNRTPHGPAEIVDIMTVNISYRNVLGVSGIILKGRSFPRINPQMISHQIFRLRQISNLKYAILGYVGNILDQVREEFIKTAEDLQCDYSIIDSIDFARLAIVSARLCPRDGNILQNGKCECGYRVNGHLVNHLQNEAIARLNETHEIGLAAGAVIMPTGSGKTRVAAIDARNIGANKILYVAHTHEILDGAENEFKHYFGNDVISRDISDIKSHSDKIVVLDTIQNIRNNLGLLANENIDYLVIDEFHHAAAHSYRSLIDILEPTFLLGLTATPFRSDRQDVLEICNQNVIVNFELRSGIDSGILCPYIYYGLFDNVDYSSIIRNVSGYSIKDLNRALIIPERDNAIIAKWREIADGLPTLAFCVSHIHAQRLSESFNNAGIAAEVYLSTTGYEQRLQLLQQLQYGDIKVLCTVDVLNEGIDLPFIECLLFLRPTESERIFYQQLGRGLRKSPGKEKTIVLDFIGNFHNAYKIVEYLGLSPDQQSIIITSNANNAKEILNLPLGCEVHFDDRVIDIFARDILDPRRASKSNIAQILIYYYQRTSRFLGKRATKLDIDRNQILHSGLYDLVFGSWGNFERLVSDMNFD